MARESAVVVPGATAGYEEVETFNANLPQTSCWYSVRREAIQTAMAVMVEQKP